MRLDRQLAGSENCHHRVLRETLKLLQSRPRRLAEKNPRTAYTHTTPRARVVNIHRAARRRATSPRQASTARPEGEALLLPLKHETSTPADAWSATAASSSSSADNHEKPHRKVPTQNTHKRINIYCLSTPIQLGIGQLWRKIYERRRQQLGCTKERGTNRRHQR